MNHTLRISVKQKVTERTHNAYHPLNVPVYIGRLAGIIN